MWRSDPNGVHDSEAASNNAACLVGRQAGRQASKGRASSTVNYCRLLNVAAVILSIASIFGLVPGQVMLVIVGGMTLAQLLKSRGYARDVPRASASFGRLIKPAIITLALFAVSLIAASAAQAVSFALQGGNLIGIVAKGDTFGHILEKIRIITQSADPGYYTSPQSMIDGQLWGEAGAANSSYHAIRVDNSGYSNIHKVYPGQNIDLTKLNLPKDIQNRLTGETIPTPQSSPGSQTAFPASSD
ncbi:MAG: hypothetical protein V1662_02425, partial [Candidatus Omnitrophota bacterium]